MKDQFKIRKCNNNIVKDTFNITIFYNKGGKNDLIKYGCTSFMKRAKKSYHYIFPYIQGYNNQIIDFLISFVEKMIGFKLKKEPIIIKDTDVFKYSKSNCIEHKDLLWYYSYDPSFIFYNFLKLFEYRLYERNYKKLTLKNITELYYSSIDIYENEKSFKYYFFSGKSTLLKQKTDTNSNSNIKYTLINCNKYTSTKSFKEEWIKFKKDFKHKDFLYHIFKINNIKKDEFIKVTVPYDKLPYFMRYVVHVVLRLLYNTSVYVPLIKDIKEMDKINSSKWFSTLMFASYKNHIDGYFWFVIGKYSYKYVPSVFYDTIQKALITSKKTNYSIYNVIITFFEKVKKDNNFIKKVKNGNYNFIKELTAEKYTIINSETKIKYTNFIDHIQKDSEEIFLKKGDKIEILDYYEHDFNSYIKINARRKYKYLVKEKYIIITEFVKIRN